MSHQPIALALVKTPIGHYQWILETDVADDETVIDRAITRFPPWIVRRQAPRNNKPRNLRLVLITDASAMKSDCRPSEAIVRDMRDEWKF